MILAALVLCALLTSAQNPGAPRGAGRTPGGGGFMPNVADPPGYIPEPRLPPPPSSTPPSLDQLNRLTPWDFDPVQGLRLGDFTLWTVDDLGQPDPTLLTYLRFEERNMEFGAVHLVVYTKGAPGINDLAFYVRYHQERMHPRQIEPGSFFGFEGDRLFAARLDVPGIVAACFTRVRPDRHGGTRQQDLVVCEVVFEKRPFDYKPLPLTHAPRSPANRVRNVQAFMGGEDILVREGTDAGRNARATGSEDSVVLYWEGANRGDYNNDGQVLVTDIIPIGRRYGNLVTDGIEDEWDRMAEGNGDAVVSYRDMWAVQEHFGANLSGYRIYRRPAGRPRAEEVLLKHRTMPLLPFTLHRPVAWSPIARYGYYYFDSELPRGSGPAQCTYRIVPYDALSDDEGDLADVEFTLSISGDDVQVLGTKPVKSTGVKKSPARKLPEPVRGRT